MATALLSFVLAPASLADPLTGPLTGPSALPGPNSPAAEPNLAALQPATALRTTQASIGRTVEVRRGDTLMKLLVDAGIARPEAHQAINALREVYSPRALKPGQSIHLILDPPDDGRGAPGPRLAALNLRPDLERDIHVERSAVTDGFSARAVARPLSRELTAAAGLIDSSLFVAGKSAGVPPAILAELIRAFSYDVNFQREIQPGDRFSVIYESYYDRSGQLAKTGPLLTAKMILSGKPLEVFRFTSADGDTDYYDATGKSVRKALLRTPVDGARISSRFGMRRHPVQGYSKMHRGVDFAAPSGTPIYAAGSGVVERAGRFGAYGKYLRIKHKSGYKTAYAHMSRIAKAMRSGIRVAQGQVVGYVGSTGRSTGPHLHYEVLMGDQQINPLKVKLAAGEQLKGDDLVVFGLARVDLDYSRRVLLGELQVAHSACSLQSAADAALFDREARPAGPRC